VQEFLGPKFKSEIVTMSTGHRPTFYPAIGKTTGSGSQQVSVKDQKSHTVLKVRQFGQGSEAEIVSKSLREELESKERNLLAGGDNAGGATRAVTEVIEKSSAPRLLTNAPAVDLDEIKKKYDDADADFSDNSDKDLESR
jgi:protein CWC15